MARQEIYGAIMSRPHNENYQELFDERVLPSDLQEVDNKVKDLAGTGRTNETVKGNAENITNLNTQFNAHKQSVEEDISALQSVRIHKGGTAPIDTIFWLDTSV